MEKKGEFRVLKPAQLYKEELQEENIKSWYKRSILM